MTYIKIAFRFASLNAMHPIAGFNLEIDKHVIQTKLNCDNGSDGDRSHWSLVRGIGQIRRCCKGNHSRFGDIVGCPSVNIGGKGQSQRMTNQWLLGGRSRTSEGFKILNLNGSRSFRALLPAACFFLLPFHQTQVMLLFTYS